MKEAVELPLTHPELYEDIGIKPPKGVILCVAALLPLLLRAAAPKSDPSPTPPPPSSYGEPGTGKTLLAKAVANSTSATFLRVVGSELIQKYLGDGPKLVRELFRVADEMAPSIVFIGAPPGPPDIPNGHVPQGPRRSPRRRRVWWGSVVAR